jgi:hypothetical protein
MTASPQELTMRDASSRDFAIDGAACRLFRDAPSWDGRRTAAVGAFRCDSAAAGKLLLDDVGDMLGREGFQALLGPMDGDTWHRYRLIAESDGSPPFLMEPVSGPHDRAAFEAAGFSPVSFYVSTRASLEQAIGLEPPVRLDGIRVTSWDGRNAEALIGGLFDMSAASFQRNAFFKSITKAAFLALYEPVLPAIDPRLVLFAHDDNGPVGFLFGLPNRLEGERPRTAILKTYASARRGVGHLLADAFHRTARDLDFSDVIHALMHVDNVSLERSGRHAGTVFRRYALMGKRLP